MLKTVMILAILALVIWFFFIKKRPSKKGEETMVECKECGTFVTQKECIYSNGAYYCSYKCLKKGE
ncbi:hypothetical protein CQA62_01700 [Helicobacter cholecystus]|uniref:Uncharacterized protein n=1 Tax=Helicobacter cholecystus TaxID=45498 RepID=A0A3D8IXZ6_9HELI|nr:PP0621 family protein [Helicobacter cholecystus]RDU70149.1 hypothetical protein CQA62_01700 [Helicobacter cholecystus]VEJ24671.1 prokaryotic metallothionein family protein [Helicobacter cholecystus]